VWRDQVHGSWLVKTESDIYSIQFSWFTESHKSKSHNSGFLRVGVNSETRRPNQIAELSVTKSGDVVPCPCGVPRGTGARKLGDIMYLAGAVAMQTV
jgi:hypothetical protein